MSDQPARVLLRVFQDEDPDLYAYLASLPKHRVRRRTRLLRLLRLGMQAEQRGTTDELDVGASPANAAPAEASLAPALPAPGPLAPYPAAVAIDADDLASVFGQ